jgi:muramidase (phage lysozyme)
MDAVDKVILGEGLLTPAQLQGSKGVVIKRAKQNQAEDNLMKFGNMIAVAEGSIKEGRPDLDPYTVGYGYKPFDPSKGHPRIRTEINFNGKKDYTTAAGKYQATATTWDDFLRKQKLPKNTPMSPDMQERFYQAKLKDRGAYDDVVNGNFDAAISKLGDEWASLPSSKAGQPKRTKEFINTTLQNLGVDTNRYASVSRGTANELTDDNIRKALQPNTSEQAQIMLAQEASDNAKAIEQAKLEDEAATSAARQQANMLQKNMMAALDLDSVFKVDGIDVTMPTSMDKYLKQLVQKYV